jgi:type II secretory pathway component PulK
MGTSRKRRLTGTVLVGVMWLLVLMMAILAVGAQNSRMDTRTSLSSVEKIRGRWLCRAGAETALAYLKDDLKDVDSLLDEWAISNADLKDVQLTNGVYTVTITDECSKLNLNTATASQLLNLDTASMDETIADSILDWRDQDEDVRTNGAESGYYLNLTPGYLCRNGNFRTPREILRVRGVTEDLFYGKDNRVYGQDGWSRFLTCASTVNNVNASGSARVNVNSASESDLTSKLSITSAQAQYIVQNRPFQSLAGLLGIRTATTTSSQRSSGASQGANPSQGGNTSGGGNSGSGNSANPQMNQTAPQSINTLIQAPFPMQWPEFSTVAAQLAADAPPPGGGSPSGDRGGRRGPGGRGGQQGGQNEGAGRGERGGGERGEGDGGEGQGGRRQGGRRGRDGGGGPGGPGGRRGMGQGRVRGGVTGGGRQQGAAQTKPLDWATFSRIFDQITLTDNTTITGVININTVSLDVLRAFFEGNEDLATKVIAYRESMGGEITNVCDLINIQGMTQQILAPYLDQFSVRSSVFLIRATAKSASCGVQYFMEEVVNRDREAREVLYKLEGVGI